VRTAIGLFAAGVLLCSATAAGAAPKPRPDLAISSLGNPPATVQSGGSFSVRDVVRNRGRKSAKASVTSYYLSLDKRRSSGDVLLGQRSLRRLGRGRRSKGTTELTVPADTSPGVYRLLACADATKRLKEKSERNNCRASANALQVTAEQPAVGQSGGPQGGAGETTVTPPVTGSATETGDGGGGTVTPPAACGNGIDDDGDGLVDLADNGCTGQSDDNERFGELCNGFIDDDDDPTTDENGAPVTFPNAVGVCSGGVPLLVSCLPGFYNVDNNDANGCEYDGPDVPAPETCNGLDDDGDALIDDALILPADVPNGFWICEGADGWVLMCNFGFEDSDPAQPGCEAVEP
jgi:hypothetical protein